jgi:hypothetical protein
MIKSEQNNTTVLIAEFRPSLLQLTTNVFQLKQLWFFSYIFLCHLVAVNVTVNLLLYFSQ